MLVPGRKWLLLLVLVSTGAVWIFLPPSRSEGAPPRLESRAAAVGLARVDSLLTLDDSALAVGEARRQFALHGEDPLYGWQLEGRLGLALLRNGQAEDSIPHLEAVLGLNPTDPEAHRNLALALWDLGRKGRALTEYQLVVELAPTNHVARLEYGNRLQDFTNYGRARAEFEIASSLCGGCLDAQRALADLSLAAREYAAAVAPLTVLLASQPTPELERMMLVALSGAEDHTGLLDWLDQRPVVSWSVEEANLVVQAESALGESTRSLELGEHLISGGTGGPVLRGDLLSDPMLWGRVSLNLLKAGHYEVGLSAADRAVELDEHNTVFRNNRVVLLLRLGRKEEAAREWETVLQLDPSLAEKELE